MPHNNIHPPVHHATHNVKMPHAPAYPHTTAVHTAMPHLLSKMFGIKGGKRTKRSSRSRRSKRIGGNWGAVIQNAAVPLMLLGTQQAFSRRRRGGHKQPFSSRLRSRRLRGKK